MKTVMPFIQKKIKSVIRNCIRCWEISRKGICTALLLYCPEKNLLNSMLGRMHIKIHSLLVKFYTFINLILEKLPYNVFKTCKDPLSHFPWLLDRKMLFTTWSIFKATTKSSS